MSVGGALSSKLAARRSGCRTIKQMITHYSAGIKKKWSIVTSVSVCGSAFASVCSRAEYLWNNASRTSSNLCCNPQLWRHDIHRVPQKTFTFCFFEQLCQKLTDFNNFGMWNPKKIWHEHFTYCPPYLSDVATVPWEIQKKSFSTLLFIHTSDY